MWYLYTCLVSYASFPQLRITLDVRYLIPQMILNSFKCTMKSALFSRENQSLWKHFHTKVCRVSWCQYIREWNKIKLIEFNIVVESKIQVTLDDQQRQPNIVKYILIEIDQSFIYVALCASSDLKR